MRLKESYQICAMFCKVLQDVNSLEIGERCRQIEQDEKIEFPAIIGTVPIIGTRYSLKGCGFPYPLRFFYANFLSSHYFDIA